ncbi:hypothetical protein [Paenibacillus turpanensis]|uniref:hypothetical protein n=1 Tax=Paenibacillus turpanensis TaxID=2689078 RepID=UPI00140BCA40|nr:hypothetical protein [Paenibacillus turpanensis]
MSNQQQDPFFTDWTIFERLFGNPFQDGGNHAAPFDPAALEKQMKTMVEQSFRQTGFINSQYSYECFETHNQIITKFTIPSNVKPKQLKLSLTRFQAELQGPNLYKQTVAFPVPVDPYSGKAIFKNSILQVQARKMLLDKEEPYEVAIRY